MEGCERRWNLDTLRFLGENGQVTGVEVEEVKWTKDENGRMNLKRTGKIETIKADLVFLSMGFVHPLYEGLLQELDVKLNERKNVAVDGTHKTSVNKVFAAGDAALGASLVVRAIASGRDAAASIDEFLMA